MSCCIDCRVVRVQQACEIPEVFGRCHAGSVCDGGARCVPRVKQAGDICRDPVDGGDTCDVGDTCDGTSLECPTSGREAGCELSVDLVSKRAALATCRGQNLAEVAKKDTACEGEGALSDDTASGLAIGVGTAGALSGQRVIDPVSKRLKGGKRVSDRKQKLKLRLNRAGKELLKNSASGQLNVLVSVQVQNGGRGTRRLEKVLQFRR